MEAVAQTHVIATLLTSLIQELVDTPDEVRVSPIEGSQSVIFEVRVASSDVRRVIGRKGRTADAIRELMISMGGKAGRRYLLEIVEPVRQRRAA